MSSWRTAAATARGRWGDRRLVPAAWVSRSTRPISRTDHPAGLLGFYGHCWWVAGRDPELENTSIPPGTFSPVGFGGSYLTVIPSADVVVTVLVDTENRQLGQPSPHLREDQYQHLIDSLLTRLR